MREMETNDDARTEWREESKRCGSGDKEIKLGARKNQSVKKAAGAEANECEEKKRQVKGGKSVRRGDRINEGRGQGKGGVCETREEKGRKYVPSAKWGRSHDNVSKKRVEKKGEEEKRPGRTQVKSKLLARETERRIICAEGGVWEESKLWHVEGKRHQQWRSEASEEEPRRNAWSGEGANEREKCKAWNAES
jgi:hypothetical protein